MAVRMLEKLGIHVDIAENGGEAVHMAGTRHYDVIFMDCQMPEMNGYEAVHEIRRTEPQGRRATIIAMTAEAIEGSRERCIQSGMDGFIAKPVKLEELLATVEKIATSSLAISPPA